jgi:hypothetical protein
MAAPCNADVIKAFSQQAPGFSIIDDLNASLATGATSQAGGLAARGEILRITQSVVGGSVVLPSLTTGEAPAIILIINDSPNSINVGGSAGDKVNGVATTAIFGAGIIAIPTLTFCLFVASLSPTGVGGTPVSGAAGGNPNNWHTAVSAGT